MQEGLRRGELTSALAPRIMPVTVEEVRREIEAENCDGTAMGYIKNESFLSEELQNTGFNEAATIFATRHNNVQTN